MSFFQPLFKPVVNLSWQNALALRIAVVSLLAFVWAMTPVQRPAEPGHLLRFEDASGNELGVYGLTVRNNRSSTNASTVKNWWARKVPPQVATMILRTEFGDGQAAARSDATVAASVLNGNWLEVPTLRIPGRVTGTSSGLAWSLAVLGNHDPEFLAGRKVAVTGTIQPSGAVLAIGGLKEKLVAPEIGDFDTVLVPAAQIEEAYEYTREWVDDETKPMIIGVRSLDEAVLVLCLQDPVSPTCRLVLSRRKADQIEMLSEKVRSRLGTGPLVVLHNANTSLCTQVRITRRGWDAKFLCVKDSAAGSQVVVSRRR
jgi:hypothetical protein